jgi:hypothetical protein
LNIPKKVLSVYHKIAKSNLHFNIRVKDKDIPLAPGMAVTAKIKIEERRVILNDSGGIIQMATIQEATLPKKTLRI